MPLYIDFELVSTITNHRTIAVGNRIRELQRLVDEFGPGRWRKMSGEAYIRFPNSDVVLMSSLPKSTGTKLTASA